MIARRKLAGFRRHLAIIGGAGFLLLAALPGGTALGATVPAPTTAGTVAPQAYAPYVPALGSGLPILAVTGVAANNSSVVVSFNAVRGAADYRIFDGSTNPPTVKYAGLAPGSTTPLQSIEWNRVEDGLAHTITVQAVNQLGPFPQNNLMSFNDTAIYPPPGMMGLGANEGMTMDGYDSINGQGPYTNMPMVIAQSVPIVVQANSAHLPVPSGTQSSQVYLDTFGDSEAATLQTTSTTSTTVTDLLNAGTSLAANIVEQYNDNNCSHQVFDSGHWMNVLCDGPTPTKYLTNLHAEYGSTAFTPLQTASLGSGQMLHFTAEVDSQVDVVSNPPIPDGRWLEFKFVPANSPITNFGSQPGGPNAANRELDIIVQSTSCSIGAFQGSPTETFFANCARPVNGIGLDQRTRWDIFFTSTHVAVFENGHLDGQGNLPGSGLGFTAIKSYAAAYLFRSAQEQTALQSSGACATDLQWCNNTLYSDERHWDNLGFEVVPAPTGTDFSSLASLINLPAVLPPLPAS